MKTKIVIAAGLALLLPPLAARAQSALVVAPAQSRAFALGYTLRACDLRAVAFTLFVNAGTGLLVFGPTLIAEGAAR